MSIVRDNKGFPILVRDEVMLADVPNAGVSGVDPNAAGGNPRHDLASGKFGSGGGGGGGKSGGPKPQESNKSPAGVDPQEWARRLDAVREAAREFEQFAPRDIQDWLKGKVQKHDGTTELTPEEVDAFLADVRAQQLDDLIDIIDFKSRTQGRARRFVRVEAPRGYAKKTMNSLTDDELHGLRDRLFARGWTAEEFQKNIVAKLSRDRRAIVAPDQQPPEPSGGSSGN